MAHQIMEELTAARIETATGIPVGIVQHARELAVAIAAQIDRGNGGALMRHAEWLDSREAEQGHMMLVHRFGMATDGIYLGPSLRTRLSLNDRKALFAPEELVGVVCPMELLRITAYYQHFSSPKGEELLQVVRVCPKVAKSEWLVSYSLRIAMGRPYILTLFRALNDLLAADSPDHHLRQAKQVALATLSVREREVLALLATGKSSAEVAERLNISPFTVKSHRQSIMARLGVNNVAGLVRYAVEMGL